MAEAGGSDLGEIGRLQDDAPVAFLRRFQGIAEIDARAKPGRGGMTIGGKSGLILAEQKLYKEANRKSEWMAAKRRNDRHNKRSPE